MPRGSRPTTLTKQKKIYQGPSGDARERSREEARVGTKSSTSFLGKRRSKHGTTSPTHMHHIAPKRRHSDMVLHLSGVLGSCRRSVPTTRPGSSCADSKETRPKAPVARFFKNVANMTSCIVGRRQSGKENSFQGLGICTPGWVTIPGLGPRRDIFCQLPGSRQVVAAEGAYLARIRHAHGTRLAIQSVLVKRFPFNSFQLQDNITYEKSISTKTNPSMTNPV